MLSVPVPNAFVPGHIGEQDISRMPTFRATRPTVSQVAPAPGALPATPPSTSPPAPHTQGTPELTSKADIASDPAAILFALPSPTLTQRRSSHRRPAKTLALTLPQDKFFRGYAAMTSAQARLNPTASKRLSCGQSTWRVQEQGRPEMVVPKSIYYGTEYTSRPIADRYGRWGGADLAAPKDEPVASAVVVAAPQAPAAPAVPEPRQKAWLKTLPARFGKATLRLRRRPEFTGEEASSVDADSAAPTPMNPGGTRVVSSKLLRRLLDLQLTPEPEDTGSLNPEEPVPEDAGSPVPTTGVGAPEQNPSTRPSSFKSGVTEMGKDLSWVLERVEVKNKHRDP
ncbi:hypothetical protein EK21DRAFT_118047 [Setomelanomma holmii]|uniref:Uncharacterized protein n=1 Tax=Setomelanomma holmii TaxID=210430 RepID=A0A9P4GY40_9PLEO|nr:hypothetical protein EK21DRAFT_118047 [Setomelanomma holmii]